MARSIKDNLVEIINRSLWWHVHPADLGSYKKRGKFLASTYQQAEFYGRPNDNPEKVAVNNPLYGFSEVQILKKLFPKEYGKLYQGVLKEDNGWYKRRINLDRKIYMKARRKGYDAIVLLGVSAKKYLIKNIKPRSIELNLCK